MASKKDRQRQVARAAYARRLERQAAHARRVRQAWISSVAAVLVIAIGLSVAAVLGAFSPAKKASASAKPKASASASPSASATPSAVAALVDGKCVYTASGTAAKKVSLPSATPPNSKTTYTATIKTNRGNIVINLLTAKAPCTVNSFVSLADQKYFDNTTCHRLVTEGIYVLQCGDPSGTGSGGPGYEFGDENLTGASYTAGTVAMANAGAGTNGSQFFMVYKDSTTLPASYTPFGTVTSGLNIIQAVAAAGSDNANGAGDGAPKDKVEIDSVTIKKS